jgi:hypothetical protein
MQFIAVHYTMVDGDAFLIPLDKSNLDVGTYDDLMKMTNRTCLAIRGASEKHACSQNGY